MTDTLAPFRKPYGYALHILPGRSILSAWKPQVRLISIFLAGFVLGVVVAGAGR